jgi:hypothetical protein
MDVPCSQSGHTYAYRRPYRDSAGSPFSVTFTLSRGTTATTEKVAPGGFPHLMQPQTWLRATSHLMATLTGRSVRLQTRVPPAGCAGNHRSSFRCFSSVLSAKNPPRGYHSRVPAIRDRSSGHRSRSWWVCNTHGHHILHIGDRQECQHRHICCTEYEEFAFLKPVSSRRGARTVRLR